MRIRAEHLAAVVLGSRSTTTLVVVRSSNGKQFDTIYPRAPADPGGRLGCGLPRQAVEAGPGPKRAERGFFARRVDVPSNRRGASVILEQPHP